MTTQNINSNYQQRYDILQSFDKTFIDLQSNDKGKNEFIEEFEPMEEQNLSQKMSQLSTNNTTTNEKESLMMKNIKDEIEKIPNYLTKHNKSFKQMMYQALSTVTAVKSNKIDETEELRKIAILIYKIMFIQTYQLLWTVYLKSGIGQLIIQSQKQPIYPTNLPIWPKEIKLILQSTKANKTNENKICMNFVHNTLNELNNQLKQYQMELNSKANNFQGYTLNIQKMIETYIEQNIQSLRMEIEHKIELLHYDYHIRALKLEYFRHKPNVYQEQLMTQVCQSKYEQETTEQEYHFLKKQIDYYNSPSQSFECSSIAQSTLIDSIQNPAIRQQLLKQYRETAKQSRANLFHIYIKCAEEQREEYQKKYKDYEQKISFNNNEKLPFVMIQLINERCNKISERIQCIYKFKAQSTLS